MKRTLLLFFAIFILAAPGCNSIRDDLSDCPTGKYICFRSVMEKYTYPEIVDYTTLYLYDESGSRVYDHTWSPEEIAAGDYSVLLPFQPDGTYTLVASMNSGDDYEKTGLESLSGFHISLKPDRQDTVSRKQADIHHGQREIVFSRNTHSKVEYDLVDMYKNTNHINLKVVSGGYELPENHILSALITADNGEYDYLNVCNGAYRTYLPHGNNPPVPDAFYYNFTVMHTKIGGDITLTLQEIDVSGRPRSLQQKDIMEDLRKIYPTDAKLDQEDIFEIEMVLGPDMGIVEIKVNGWYTVRGGEEV